MSRAFEEGQRYAQLRKDRNRVFNHSKSPIMEFEKDYSIILLPTEPIIRPARNYERKEYVFFISYADVVYSLILTEVQNANLSAMYGDVYELYKGTEIIISRTKIGSEYIYKIKNASQTNATIHEYDGPLQQPRSTVLQATSSSESTEKLVEAKQDAPVASPQLLENARAWWKQQVCELHADYGRKIASDYDMATKMEEMELFRGEMLETCNDIRYSALTQADKDAVSKQIPQEYNWLRFVWGHVQKWYTKKVFNE